MIYSTFIAPTEFPNTSLEIKRALLTFDRVILADPGDRDFFPPQAFSLAMGLPPIIGINTGPVRPLGKSRNFDNEFDKLLDEIDVSRKQGLVDVVASYDVSTSNQMTIGAVQMGEYPLNPRFLLIAYRNLCRDTEMITHAISGDQHLFKLSDEEIASIALERAAADGGINNDPRLPDLEGPLAREALRSQFSSIARARLAAVIMLIGYCVSKQLIPFFGPAS